MKNIFKILSLTLLLSSCTQIQTQIQNQQGKVYYNNKEEVKTSIPQKKVEKEIEIWETKKIVNSYIVLQ